MLTWRRISRWFLECHRSPVVNLSGCSLGGGICCGLLDVSGGIRMEQVRFTGFFSPGPTRSPPGCSCSPEMAKEPQLPHHPHHHHLQLGQPSQRTASGASDPRDSSISIFLLVLAGFFWTCPAEQCCAICCSACGE